MVWMLDLHRLNFRRKTEGLWPKKGHLLEDGGICLGGPQGSGPPNWLVNKPWGQRKSLVGKTHRDFRGKIPGPNVALERWRPYKRPWVFWRVENGSTAVVVLGWSLLKPLPWKLTRFAPLKLRLGLPVPKKVYQFQQKNASILQGLKTVSFRGYELYNWAVIKKYLVAKNLPCSCRDVCDIPLYLLVHGDSAYNGFLWSLHNKVDRAYIHLCAASSIQLSWQN